MSERKTDDGTYPNVEEELAKVDERAAAAEPPAPSMDPAEARKRMALGYSTGARQLAARCLDELFGTEPTTAPDASKEARAAAVEHLASVLLGTRDYAIEECANGIEDLEAYLAPEGVLVDGPHKGKAPRVRTYSSMIRGLTMASLVGSPPPETH